MQQAPENCRPGPTAQAPAKRIHGSLTRLQQKNLDTQNESSCRRESRATKSLLSIVLPVDKTLLRLCVVAHRSCVCIPHKQGASHQSGIYNLLGSQSGA